MKRLITFNTDSDIEEFAAICQKYSFDIDVQRDRYIIDAKSVLGLFSLDKSKPLYVVAHCHDKDADAFFKAIGRFLVNE